MDDEAFGPLIAATGLAVDLADEHARYGLVRSAIQLGLPGDVLRQALAAEPEQAVASALVAFALERVDESEHAAWLRLASDWTSAGYLKQRSAEVVIARQAESGRLTANATVKSITGWSDWLQRKLSTTSNDPELLKVLMKNGRTRRIRDTADLRRAALLGRALSDGQIAQLLDDLCTQLGCYLDGPARAGFETDPPGDVDAFTDAVIRAEGFDPLSHDVRVRRQIRRLIDAAFHRERERRADAAR